MAFNIDEYIKKNKVKTLILGKEPIQAPIEQQKNQNIFQTILNALPKINENSSGASLYNKFNAPTDLGYTGKVFNNSYTDSIQGLVNTALNAKAKILTPQGNASVLSKLPLTTEQQNIINPNNEQNIQKAKDIMNLIKQTEINRQKRDSSLDNEYSNLSNTHKTISKLIGGVAQIMPMVATSAINPVLGSTVFGSQVFGNSLGESLNEGATIEQARQYAGLNAIKEMVVEKIVGGLPFVDGIATQGIKKVAGKLFENKVFKTLTEKAINIFGEGAEEVISDIITPYIKRVVYDKNAQNPNIQDLGMSFLGGAVTSGLLGGGGVSTKNLTNQIKLYNDIIELLPQTQRPQKLTENSTVETFNNAINELKSKLPIVSQETKQPLNATEQQSNTISPIQQENVNQVANIDNVAQKPIENVQENQLTPEKIVELQKIVKDGEQILKDGVYNGKKLSVVELDVVNNSVNNAKSQLNIPKTNTKIYTIREVKEIYKQKLSLMRKRDKVIRDNPLTEKERIQVDRLLKNEISYNELPKDINLVNVLNVYKAKKAVNDILDPITNYNKKRKQRLRDKALTMLDKINTFIDKSNGIKYNVNTAERNIEDIVPNTETAKQIIDTYFTPVHISEAQSNKFKNQYRNLVKQLNLTKEESQAVQMIGEGNAVPNDFPNVDKGKVNNAIVAFRKIYNELLDRANTILIKNGYAPIEARKDYFPHFSDPKEDNVIKELSKFGFDVDLSNLPTDIAGRTHEFKPGKQYFANFTQRKGKTTEFDAVEGFDRYIEGISNVIFHTENIQNLRALENSVRYKLSDKGVQDRIDAINKNDSLTENEKQAALDEAYGTDKKGLSNFVTWLRNYTDDLAGKKSPGDRWFEHQLGRKLYNLSTWWQNRVGAAMIAGNPGTWAVQTIPIQQASGFVKSTSMAKALEDTMKNLTVNDGFESKSTFLTNRKKSDFIVKTPIEKANDAVSKPMYYIDNFTSQVVTRARYIDNISKGMSEKEAIKEADRFAADIMVDRSKGAMPLIFREKNPFVRLFTQFQAEQWNQYLVLLKNAPKEFQGKGSLKLLAFFMQYAISSYLFNSVYEKILGRRPALDVIGLMGSTIQNPQSFFNSVSQQIPFLGGFFNGGRYPISASIPNIPNTYNASKNIFNPEKQKKALSTLGTELAKPVIYLGLPFGGGQVKKTIEGIATVNRGGSYSLDGTGREQLQFPVDKTIGNYAKAAIFGKYSLKNAKKYVDSGFKKLSAADTSIYDAAISNGIPSNIMIDYFSATKKITGDKNSKGDTIPNSKKAKELYYISNLDLPQEQKTELYKTTENPQPPKYLPKTETAFKDYYTLSDVKQKKVDALANQGINFDIIIKAINDISDMQSLKYKNGKVIPGSKKYKVDTYINALPTTQNQKYKIRQILN